MKYLTIALCLFVLWPAATMAQSDKFLDECQVASDLANGGTRTWETMAHGGFCLKYVQGFVETWKLGAELSKQNAAAYGDTRICFPEGEGAKSNMQLAIIFLRWAKSHPEEISTEPTVNLWRAYKAKWPCLAE